MEDGKKLKMLKRHLMTSYGMTSEEYRARWGLKPDYTVVAPSYSAKRRNSRSGSVSGGSGLRRKRLRHGRKPKRRHKAAA